MVAGKISVILLVLVIVFPAVVAGVVTAVLSVLVVVLQTVVAPIGDVVCFDCVSCHGFQRW